MLELAEHVALVRSAHPTDRLLVVFEIDGPIVDQSSTAHEPDKVRPYPGALEAIRWFQLQESTFVGLNTSRPERLRADTLHTLNALGRHVRVQFRDDLLHMNQSGDEGDAVASKLEGLRAFRRAGFRPVAFVDHELSVLHGLLDADETRDILLLQTQTTSGSPRLTGPRTAAGRHFDLRALIAEPDLPDQVQLVWHGVNDEANLGEFLASTVAWGECDLRRDPRQRLVLRHDSFERTPLTMDEALLTLAIAVEAFARHGRGLKLDLKDGTGVLGEVLALVQRHEFEDDRLWFNASIEALGAEGFRRLQSAHPSAIVQCPVDFLAPLVVAAPRRARAVLRMLAGWGISRFSVAWGEDTTLSLVQALQDWGYEINLYAVPDHESFLQAVLLLPRSLTADFNFPDWNYYGRGSGERRRYHRDRTPRSTAAA